jgi:hypothetical protein
MSTFGFGVNLDVKALPECEVASKGLSEASEINNGRDPKEFFNGRNERNRGF